MAQLFLASTTRTAAQPPPVQWAHDIRNALATVGLHLDTLARLSGSRGREVVDAAHTLMARAASMCNEAMQQDPQDHAPRRGFDLMKTVAQVADLLRPTAPEGFEIRVAGSGTFPVLADPHAVFRIVFNLVNNAIAVARNGGTMTQVTLLVEGIGPRVVLRIADDGPGLPDTILAKLFREPGESATGGAGLGLAIARELAERNGALLELAPSAKGTTFVLELTGLSVMSSGGQGAMRSLGRRIAQH